MSSKQPYGAFGSSLSGELAARGMTQSKLALTLGKSPAYINQVVKAKKRPSPEWVDLIADTLEVDDKARRALHRAAALDRGFKL